MRWPIIGLSFYVANMSGSSFIGLPGSAYNDGIAVFHYEWIPAFILVFYVGFILPFYLHSKVYTAPQYLEARYGRESRLAFSGFLLLANILVDAAAAFYACAAVMQALFPGVPFWLTVTVVALIAGVYIFFGGLGAVVLNDAVQAMLIIAGGIVITILAWLAIPSWEAVREAAAPGALRLMRPADDALMPWPGAITGVLVIGIYFWCSNQFIIQRSLAARDLDQGRFGALFAGLLKIPKFPTLWQYLQSILSYVTPPVVAVFLLGIFWRRGTRWGALATLVGGILLGAICWILVEILVVFKIQYLYACGLMLLLSCVLHAAVSLATKPPPEEKLEKTTWRAEIWTHDSEQLRGKPWYANYRVLSTGLMAITAAVVVWWW